MSLSSTSVVGSAQVPGVREDLDSGGCKLVGPVNLFAFLNVVLISSSYLSLGMAEGFIAISMSHAMWIF